MSIDTEPLSIDVTPLEVNNKKTSHQTPVRHC